MPADLKKSTLGRTGLEVTRLGYGAMELRGQPRGRSVSDEQAGDILNSVLDAGINFIDTSIDYGRSEELIGEYISHRRSEYYLASKCGCPVGGLPSGAHVFTRDNIIAGVNQSLLRMRTDYLDLVQLHASPSKETLENEEVVQTLLDLKNEGKVRLIGSSSTLPHLADLVAMGSFDSFQIPYSALDREHEEWIARVARGGIGTVIRGGVAKGEVSGSAGSSHVWANFDKASLDDLREEGESRTAFLLRFTLSHSDLHTTIVGTLDPDHLRDNVAVAQKGPLPGEVYEEAKRRLAAAGVMSTAP